MNKQTGFTLIELIMVIVILGILAATALPKFADLGADARAAKANGALSSLKSAAVIAHAAQLAAGATSNTPVTLEGQQVAMVNGYPQANFAGIGVAAGLSTAAAWTGDWAAGAADAQGVGAGAVLSAATDLNHNTCQASYTAAPAAGVTQPTYSNPVTSANC